MRRFGSVFFGAATTFLLYGFTACGFTTFESTADQDRDHLGVLQPALDPKVKKVLESYKSVDYSCIPAEKLREGFEERSKRLKKFEEPIASIVNKTLQLPHAIGVRIYTPDVSQQKCSQEKLPVVLYFHGGGWVVGSLDSVDDVCRTIAHRSQCIVVSVDYRLAPENKFPAAVEDGYAVLKWAHEKAAEFGGDSSKIVVAGDSAGGNLAAATALYARDHQGPKIAFQILIYPVTNHSFETLSYFQNEKGYRLEKNSMICFWDHYLKNHDEGMNPYASPLRATSLNNLPPALILTAYYDVLRDEGESYATRLAHAGVDVKLIRYLDMIHGFISFGPEYLSANAALDVIANSLQERFQDKCHQTPAQSHPQ